MTKIEFVDFEDSISVMREGRRSMYTGTLVSVEDILEYFQEHPDIATRMQNRQIFCEYMGCYGSGPVWGNKYKTILFRDGWRKLEALLVGISCLEMYAKHDRAVWAIYSNEGAA